ncbi:MAG: type II CRISPR RNA-guided endonuclease Cas9 [Rhodospirillaceae bacterium]
MKILGVDGGIASAGWGVIDLEDETRSGHIVAVGSWMFDPPEEKGQTGTKLKSAQRRMFRGQRRVIRRRRQRMNAIRRLFADVALLPHAHRDALKIPGLNPWQLRLASETRALSDPELAVALGHIARHRGFKSNAKNRSSNAPEEDRKMLKASAETREKLSLYGTPAKTLMQDASFLDGTERRLRNREGDYTRSLIRADLEDEVRWIFRSQRRLGQSKATEALEQAFCDIAFFQRPLQDSEHLVGSCPFEKDERRAPKSAPSFELFRLASKLINIRLSGRPHQQRLSVEEVSAALDDFGAQAGFSYATLRRKLKLPDVVRFDGVKHTDESKRDIAARSGKAMAATHCLRQIIAGAHGEMAWRSLWASRTCLDLVASVVAYRSDMDRIAEGLRSIAGLPSDIADTLVQSARQGAFADFSGAAHLSAKALRAILPGLLSGQTYDAACLAVGYDHTDSLERQAFATGAQGKQALAIILKEQRISPDLVGSPTARRAAIEILKQIKAVIECHGLPDRIHIELARDLGKSIEERGRIDRGIHRRSTEKDKLREEFAREDMVGRPLRPNSNELLAFELWKRQNGRCLYTDAYISPKQIGEADNAVQVDHILPWSRFGDDSFHNKVLCLAKANQDKKNRTPFEWFEADQRAEDWHAFVARVESNAALKGLTKRNLLLRNAQEVSERFRSRNLNDTRWICRLVAEALRQVLPDEVDATGVLRRRVFVRPGGLTDRLRRAWGLSLLKKDAKGQRIPDDRHHGLDALIVAATSESLLQRATKAVQEIEAKGLPYDLPKAFAKALPWETFSSDARAAVSTLFVARAERRRGRGPAHKATLNQVRVRDGHEVVYEKKKVSDLTKKDLDRLKDPERNQALLAALKTWIDTGKPKEAMPRSPKGDPIGKVRLLSNSKVNIRLERGSNLERAGTVDRGAMVRVDVFCKPNKKGKDQFYLVPIYPHDIKNEKIPPMRAITAGKPESEWPIIDSGYSFLWSLFQNSFVKLIDSKGKLIEGYYRGTNRNTGAINLSSHENPEPRFLGIGARTLVLFEKYTVTRTGERHLVQREVRTWRGKAYT